MTILELLQTLGIFSVVVAALAWVGRVLITQLLSRDLEKFKSDLEREATAYRIRYERLHAERVGVIKEVYRRIVQAHESLRSLMRYWQGAEEPSEEEKRDIASKLNVELLNYYEENRIFFDEGLAELIDSLLNGFRQAWQKFQMSRMAKEDGDHKESREEWDKAWTQISEEVPKVRRELERKFRENLGISNE